MDFVFEDDIYNEILRVNEVTQLLDNKHFLSEFCGIIEDEDSVYWQIEDVN